MKKKQFIIIGCGRFGKSIARTLYGMGHDVLAVDRNEEIVQDIANEVTHSIEADATDENVLKSLGVRNFDVAIVTIGSNIQSSIIITSIIKELGVKYVIAKAQNEIHSKILFKIGADRVIFPERDMGTRVARNLVSSNILDYIELSSEYSIMEITAFDEWVGRTLVDLNVRSKFGLNVMAIKHKDEINISPMANDVIEKDDILIVVGHNKSFKKLQE